MSGKEVIVVHETVTHSIVKDTFSIAALTAGVGMGVYLGSSAMQWVAAILWLLMMLSAAIRHGSTGTMTIERARKRLDEIEAGTTLNTEEGVKS